MTETSCAHAQPSICSKLAKFSQDSRVTSRHDIRHFIRIAYIYRSDAAYVRYSIIYCLHLQDSDPLPKTKYHDQVSLLVSRSYHALRGSDRARPSTTGSAWQRCSRSFMRSLAALALVAFAQMCQQREREHLESCAARARQMARNRSAHPA